MQVAVRVWVCPTPSCGNFYGSSSAPDLVTAVNRRSAMRNLADEDPSEWSKITSTRDECPDCRARGTLDAEGNPIRRVPHDFAVETEAIAVA